MMDKAPDAITGFSLLVQRQNYKRSREFHASRDSIFPALMMA